MEIDAKAKLPEIVRERIGNTVILDFGGVLEGYRAHCLKFLTLSEKWGWRERCIVEVM